MIAYYLAIFILIVLGLISGICCSRHSYLSKDTCNSVKGVFILIIFMCHIAPYIIRSGYIIQDKGDFLFISGVVGYLGQLVVVMFLFYSGYGVRESIKNKGIEYVRTMPRRRILTTLLNFDIAVLVFLVANIVMGNFPPIGKIVLSLLAWDDLGNSNWYIFAIIVLYTLTYLIAYIFKNRTTWGGQILVASIILSILLSFVKPAYWYNTMWVYAIGVIWSENKDLFDKLVSRYYVFSLMSVTCFFLFVYKIPFEYRGVVFNIESAAFVILLVMITIKVSFYNRFLSWCGNHLFPLYIYERIPMMCIENAEGGREFIKNYPSLYILICLIVTFIIAFYYRKWAVKLN